MWLKVMAYFVHQGIFIVFYCNSIISTSDSRSASLLIRCLVCFYNLLSFHIHLIRIHHLCSFLFRKTLVRIRSIYTRMKLKCGNKATLNLFWVMRES